MATKFKLTRPELRRFNQLLSRYERFLPLLKVKQQQLQTAMHRVVRARRAASLALKQATEKMDPYKSVFNDIAGVDLSHLAKPQRVQTSTANVAGLTVPVFEEAIFPKASYSLFATPAWVDQALNDWRQISARQAEFDIIERQHRLLKTELAKITQRVNLFEKVKIPEAKEIIRLIRIKLGDEMTAAVGRAKIAKGKLAQTESASTDKILLEA